MDLILVKPVKGLGKIGDIVSVKDGFGRNYLLPTGFALRATKNNLQIIADKKHELEEANLAAISEANLVKDKLSNTELTFIMQAAIDKKLFGSVGGKEIARELSGIGYKISHSCITLDAPIKFLGVYDVTVALHSDVTCNIIVNIARSNSEAKDAIREYHGSKIATSGASSDTSQDITYSVDLDQIELG